MYALPEPAEPADSLFTVHYRIVSGIDSSTVKEDAMTVCVRDSADAANLVLRKVIESDPAFDPRIDARIVFDEIEQEQG